MNTDDSNQRPEAVRAEHESLRQENARLSEILRRHGIDPGSREMKPAPAKTPEARSSPQVTHHSSEPAKLALFRSLFKGREDVYALRWEAGGKSGYSPASIRNWRAVLASPPSERKRVDRDSRRLLPLTDEAIREHLLGKKTVGVYPLLTDETCWFLAVDFDKKSWGEDAVAFLKVCERYGVPASLERSRSGNGGQFRLANFARVFNRLRRENRCVPEKIFSVTEDGVAANPVTTIS